MRSIQFASGAVPILAASLFAVSAQSARAQSDVRSNHWAAGAVTRALQAGLMRTQTDGLFHGDSKVTRMEAVVALSKLGRILVDGAWKAPEKSRPVPGTVTAVWDKTNWKAEPVRRYAFAAMLTRFGDYVAKGLPRPVAGAALGKSEVLPEVPVKLSPQSPAYESLTYLARNRMIKPASVLLNADSAALSGSELSRALAELATGVTEKLTDLAKNADGSTKEGGSQKPPAR